MINLRGLQYDSYMIVRYLEKLLGKTGFFISCQIFYCIGHVRS
jgi:hypothetical protein